MSELHRDQTIRDHLARQLAWRDAHVDFSTAVESIPEEMCGAVAPGIPHTLWQLVEHIRITQADILDFCTNPQYAEREWPREYWPEGEAPASPEAWDRSVSAVQADTLALQGLARDTSIDLTDAIPHGSGQTYLRELILAADHTAYHVGQIVLLRRALGIWAGG